ncbi:mitochondrial cardiolipin hydrolase [Papilio machaon]|uniref:mitochondrial cardiolipin hydrolase n=1 Tax=Papilio machaon TaxID=76193 RepID=UPI001E663555|nr:mitochondrial cardiolipin hydrolase [Papilio machaon]
MRINLRVLSSAAAIAITCAVSAAAYFYKSRITEINEVMVFCKLQYNAYNYFDKLLSFIDAATKSVNVCMPGIHNPAIQGRLVQLIKKKNIKARIIIDRSGYNKSTEFFIKELIDAGAEIKCEKNDAVFTMQHKFCLIDDRILMTGTLNWGNDRSCDHWNYVYITSKLLLVDPVRKEFYRMWEEFSSDLLRKPYSEYTTNDSDAETVEIVNPEENTDESGDFESVVRAPTIDNTELTPNIDALIF